MGFLTRPPSPPPAAPSVDDGMVAALRLIREYEGMRLVGYICPTGHPTVGYGHTGPEVRVGMRITEAEAERLLAEDIKKFVAVVRKAIGSAPTAQREMNAYVSLAFNIGPGHFAASTTLRRHNAGDKAGAAEALTWWNKGTVGGSKVVLPGLVRRRAAERAVYLGI